MTEHDGADTVHGGVDTMHDGADVTHDVADVVNDGLETLRESIDHVDRLPVSDRVEVFERVNDGIAAELARLDEV